MAGSVGGFGNFQRAVKGCLQQLRDRRSPQWFRTLTKSVAVLAIVASAFVGTFAPAAWAQEADLAVSKLGPDSAAADTNVTYSITVTNIGPDAALSAQLGDPIPPGMTFVSLTQNNGPAFLCTDPGAGNGGTVTCTNAAFASGNSANFTLVTHIPSATPPGTFFTNIATATTSTFDPNDENNSSAATTLVSGGTSADLGITKSGPSAATPGSNIVYSLLATNGGPDAAASVIMQDPLPAGLTFVSLSAPAGWSCTTPPVGSGGSVSCSILSFTAGASAAFTLTAQIPGGTASGTTFSNTATISSASADPNSENNSSIVNTIVSDVDVGVSKSGPASVVRGQNITYTLIVSNAGPDSANYTLFDSLPGDLTFQSLTQNTGPSASCSTPPVGNSGSITCNSIIVAGTSAQFTLVVNSTDAAAPSRTNTATVSTESADPNPNNNSSSFTTAITPGSTTTSLTASPNPSAVGQPVTFTATITPSTATGTVTFTIDGAAQPPVAVSGGQASLVTSTLSVGNHTVVANYSGGGVFNPSSSIPLTQTVNKGATTTSVSAAPNPSKPGQPVTFTATVAVTAPAQGTPTGTVTFTIDGVAQPPITLLDGQAALPTSTLPAGDHIILASYSGSGNFNASSSAPLTQTVNKGATTTSVSAAPNPSKPGEPVTFTATVAVTAPAQGTATGTVTFTEGTTTLGTVALASGTASFTTSDLTVGSHTVTASYSGSSAFDASTGTVPVTIDPRVGPEFRVNTFTAGTQQQSSVAPLSNDGFVVAWASDQQDGSGYGIYAQRYNARGNKVGGEFRVNDAAAGNQSRPSVAGLSEGFVVLWQSVDQDGSGLGIYGQRYNQAGAKAGSEFLVNGTTAKGQMQPSVAGLSGGGFIAVWTSQGQDGSLSGIYARRYKADGTSAGGEFRVNTTRKKDQSMPSVAGLIGGGFIVTWQSETQDGSGFGIFGQRYTAAGARAGGEFRINTASVQDQLQPSVPAALDDGGFVVAWQSNGQDGAGFGIYAQRYAKNGTQVGAEFRVNTTTAMNQARPSVAGFADGGFVVTWASRDKTDRGIFAQVYDAQAQPVDTELAVNTTTMGKQSQPSAAAFSDGNFVVIWTSQNQDGSLEGIYGQRFRFDGL